jgi:hypothetical protein
VVALTPLESAFMPVYCTSYCNHGHDTATGKPVNHACYVLPPKAIALEQAGDYNQPAKPTESTHTMDSIVPFRRPATPPVFRYGELMQLADAIAQYVENHDVDSGEPSPDAVSAMDKLDAYRAAL